MTVFPLPAVCSVGQRVTSILQQVTRVCFDLKDLLLQAVDTQSSFGKIQAHSVVSNTVHHVQVGLRAAAPNGYRDAEDVDIATAALRLWRCADTVGKNIRNNEGKDFHGPFCLMDSNTIHFREMKRKERSLSSKHPPS